MNQPGVGIFAGGPGYERKYPSLIYRSKVPVANVFTITIALLAFVKSGESQYMTGRIREFCKGGGVLEKAGLFFKLTRNPRGL